MRYEKRLHIRLNNGKHYSVSSFQRVVNPELYNEYTHEDLAESLGYTAEEIEKKWIEVIDDIGS